MKDEKWYGKLGKELEDAHAKCPNMESWVSWLRQAYWANASAIEHVLAEHRELRQLFMANVPRPLTVREAQLLGVCRICRKPSAAPFLLSYGKEHACEGCVAADKKTPGPLQDLADLEKCVEREAGYDNWKHVDGTHALQKVLKWIREMREAK